MTFRPPGSDECSRRREVEGPARTHDLGRDGADPAAAKTGLGRRLADGLARGMCGEVPPYEAAKRPGAPGQTGTQVPDPIGTASP